MEKECVWCQSTFEATNAGKKYCSQSCRQSAYLKRNGMNLKQGSDFEFGEDKQHDNVNLLPIIDSKQKEKSLSPVWKNARIIQLIEEKLTSNCTTYWCKETLENKNAVEKSSLIWVGLRIKCLLHNLLLLSYKGRVNSYNIRLLLQTFQKTESSFCFRNLPTGFPFWQQLEELKTQLEHGLETASESASLRLFISIPQKATIIWMLYEMSPIIPLKKYRELFPIKK